MAFVLQAYFYFLVLRKRKSKLWTMQKYEAAQWRSACPLNISLEIFGDRWSLLIVRDLMFKGSVAYKDFLDSQEKIATNILAERLRRLEANGIIEKRPNADDARKIDYRLTSKGMDLAPVLIEMIIWAARHEDTAAPREIIRAMTQDRDAFVANLRRRWKSAGR
jgi:DNA-binding HxlR family transcriptional regulator